jgi:hypothetical protein
MMKESEKRHFKSAGALDTTKKAVARGKDLDMYDPPKGGGEKKSITGVGGPRPGELKKGY